MRTPPTRTQRSSARGLPRPVHQPGAPTGSPRSGPLESPPTWQRLTHEAAGCTRCALHEQRANVVLGSGDPEADLVLIGVAPGRHEDLTGEPFAGAVGNLVDNLLLENGLRRSDVYLTTLVKCRPPHGREPTREEIDTCAPFLQAQLARLRPKVVLALGETVTHLLLRRRVPIHRFSGYRLALDGSTLIPTYDPAVALAGNGRAMAALRRDVRTATGIVDGRIAGAGAALEELQAVHAGLDTAARR